MDFISDADLLSNAIEFRVGYEPLYAGKILDHRDYKAHVIMDAGVTVRNMGSRNNGPEMWAILKGSYNLSKSGKWVWPSMPSSRPESFYKLCRYSSRDKAIAYYRYWYAAIVKWGLEQSQGAILNYSDIPRGRIRCPVNFR